jgi:hypothetical protein
VIPHIDSVTIIENAEEETPGEFCSASVFWTTRASFRWCHWGRCRVVSVELVFGHPEASRSHPKAEGVDWLHHFLWQTIIDNDHDAPQRWTFGRVAARNDGEDEHDPERRNFYRRRADDDRPFL